MPDAERGYTRYGYPALADWIAHDPDGETLIFRRFNKLTARNLLHLQSQLIILEAKLEKLDREIFESKDFGFRDIAWEWEKLVERAKANMPEEKKRMELYLQIQTKLKEYRMLP